MNFLAHNLVVFEKRKFKKFFPTKVYINLMIPEWCQCLLQFRDFKTFGRGQLDNISAKRHNVADKSIFNGIRIQNKKRIPWGRVNIGKIEPFIVEIYKTVMLLTKYESYRANGFWEGYFPKYYIGLLYT